MLLLTLFQSCFYFRSLRISYLVFYTRFSINSQPNQHTQNVNDDMERTSHDKPDQSEKDLARLQIMKGASALDLRDIAKYDVQNCHESVAKPSKIAERNGCDMRGDDDVWIEKRLVHKETGRARSFFFSKKTGRRVPDEPPSGASKVLYLKTQPQEVKTNLAEKHKIGCLSRIFLCTSPHLSVLECDKPPASMKFNQNTLPSTIYIPNKRTVTKTRLT